LPLCEIARWNRPFASGDEHRDRFAARGFAHDRDTRRVAAEGPDIVFHPAQRRDLVFHALVARRFIRRLRRQLGMGEETEDTEAVIDGDDDDTAPGQVAAVIAGLGARAAEVAAAVDPDDDGEVLRLRGRPHVQVQAVFAFRIRHPLRGLGAGGRIGMRGLHALPRHDRLRRAPAQLADRRRREGHAEERVHPGGRRADDLPSRDPHRVRLGRAGQQASGDNCRTPHDVSLIFVEMTF
jgi:hypothetical protein